MFRHDAGVDANTLPLADEMEVLDALALELLVVVAFLAYLEVVVAFLAESVVYEQHILLHSVSL